MAVFVWVALITERIIIKKAIQSFETQMKKYLLEITVFITGMGIMVFEIVGSRVLAPYVGTTTIVWSILIGIILAALSLGYWYGGRLADRKAEYYHFSMLLFFAAIFIALTGFFKTPVMTFLENSIGGFRWETIWASLIMFAPASFFMAAVSPYAARLRLASVKETGTTVGNLYAISTAGSILGAFLTGLVLLPYLGNTKIIYSLAVLLLLASLLAFSARWMKAKVAVTLTAVVLLIFANSLDNIFLKKGIIHIRSAYFDIMVGTGTDTFSNINVGGGTNKPILTLQTGNDTIQSAMFADGSTDLVLPYQIFYKGLTPYFSPGAKNILVIGGGAYSYPRNFLSSNPEAHADVVEIDPKMTEVAKKYFNLADDGRLTSYNLDGRVFLNRNQKKYDAVYVDSFRTYVPPYQLTTVETAQKIFSSLTDSGAVYVNLISAVEGESAKFFQAEYATYKKIFPQVYIFRVAYPYTDIPQNLILVATKSGQRLPLQSSDPNLEGYLQHGWEGEVAMVRPLIDDFAPVSDYMFDSAKQVKQAN